MRIQTGIAGTGTVVVRAEEVLIVVLVLLLWVAAIALFFNRWGKIRMLEPYQPKFQQQQRQSCAIVDPNPLQVNIVCTYMCITTYVYMVLMLSLRITSIILSPNELARNVYVATKVYVITCHIVSSIYIIHITIFMPMPDF